MIDEEGKVYESGRKGGRGKERREERVDEGKKVRIVRKFYRRDSGRGCGRVEGTVEE